MVPKTQTGFCVKPTAQSKFDGDELSLYVKGSSRVFDLQFLSKLVTPIKDFQQNLVTVLSEFRVNLDVVVQQLSTKAPNKLREISVRLRAKIGSQNFTNYEQLFCSIAKLRRHEYYLVYNVSLASITLIMVEIYRKKLHRITFMLFTVCNKRYSSIFPSVC